MTLDRKHHTIYTLGMICCKTKLKGKGSYNHALKIVEHLGRHFIQPIHEVTPQMINDFKIMRLKGQAVPVQDAAYINVPLLPIRQTRVVDRHS